MEKYVESQTGGKWGGGFERNWEVGLVDALAYGTIARDVVTIPVSQCFFVPVACQCLGCAQCGAAVLLAQRASV